MRRQVWLIISLGLVLGIAFMAKNRAAASPDTDTETVLSTHRVKPGMENDYLKLLDQDWATLRKLGLVLEQPRILLRGEDEPGRTYFVEIFTWKNHDVPDHAPPEVWTTWKKMNAATEDWGGHRGIEAPEVHMIELGK